MSEHIKLENGRRPRARRWIAALVIALFALDSPNAFAEDPALANLAGRLGADRFHADHIVVIDLSGSMLWECVKGSKKRASVGPTRFDSVLRALPSLLNAIPPGDYVEVIGFRHDSVSDPSLLVANWTGAESTGRLIAAVRERLRVDPKNMTNLGIAQSAAKAVAARPTHNEIQFLYFLTDGTHEPGPSDGGYASSASPLWQQDIEDWRHLWASDSHRLSAYLFGLYDVTDAGELGKTFDHLQFLTFADPASLNGYFENNMANALRLRVEVLLDREAAAGGVDVVWPTETFELRDGAGEVPVTLRSRFANLPIRVTPAFSWTAEGDAPAVEPVALPPVVLEPGAETALTVPIRAAIAKESGWRREMTARWNAAATLTPAVWEPEAEFDSAGVGSRKIRDLPESKEMIEARYRVGRWGPWHIAALAAIVLAAAGLGLASIPRTIDVTVTFVRVPEGAARPVERRLSRRGTLRIGGSDGDIRDPLLPRTVGTLQIRPWIKGGGGVELTVDAHDLRVNGKNAAAGTRWPADGPTSLRRSDGLEIRIVGNR
ncbi:MAG: VWA domain-containing protein [Deltaproteobacteria bacterium]|nr:VWA domain-containing protein [Deltaproteobacteria bacterium]